MFTSNWLYNLITSSEKIKWAIFENFIQFSTEKDYDLDPVVLQNFLIADGNMSRNIMLTMYGYDIDRTLDMFSDYWTYNWMNRTGYLQESVFVDRYYRMIELIDSYIEEVIIPYYHEQALKWLSKNYLCKFLYTKWFFKYQFYLYL